MYKHMHNDYFTEYHRHIHRTIDRLVICTGLYYIQAYMVYTNLHYMHRHKVTILYTQQCIQSPPTDVQHT